MATVTMSGSLTGVGTLSGAASIRNARVATSLVGSSTLSANQMTVTHNMVGSLSAATRLANDGFYNTSYLVITNIDSPRDATDFAQLVRKNIPHTVGDIITAVNKFGTMQRYRAYVQTQASPGRIAALWDTISSGTMNYYG